jgi:phage-related protein (TIGR01555 family)
MTISSRLRTWARTWRAAPLVAKRFKLPEVHPDIPKDAKMAMDDALSSSFGFLNDGSLGFVGFRGYPILAELTQLPEYRMLSEKTAQAMIRKWVKLVSNGEGDKTERIKKLEAAMVTYRVREVFGECAKLDGFFGRGQLFIDVGMVEGPELETPLIMDKAKIAIGSLRKFKVIEPLYTFPYRYNSSNPMADDYYNPRTWYIMSQQVHASRLLLFVSRPVPDILKPSYNFGGMSMSQLAEPYVDNWLKTRASVGRLVRNFSLTGIKTNMSAVLAGGSVEDDDSLVHRAEIFTDISDNTGLMLLDMTTEEPFQLNIPLTTVDKLQAQAQEQMASVSNTPLSILLGITPTGLNASTDGEIRTFYDHIADMQQVMFADNLKVVIDILQLNLDGVIDPDITAEFVPLWQMDTKAMSEVRKADADAATVYFEMGAISAEEVRAKLASDPESGYTGLPEVTIEPTPEETDEPEAD